MKSSTLFQALAISCALLFPVAVMAAPQSSAPISVNTCEYAPHPFDPATGYVPAHQGGDAALTPDVYGHPLAKPPQGATPVLAIDFTNRTNRTISLVDFAYIGDGKMVTEVRDVGTFAPGVEIKHEFSIALETFPTASQRCVPLQVRFADGSTWKNPRLPR